MKQFEIKDSQRLLVFFQEDLPAMEWVFLTEKLVGVLAKCDDDLAVILRTVTGLETNDLKKSDMEVSTKIMKGLLNAVSLLSDNEKIDIYNRILKGTTFRTPEGGVIFITCDSINNLIKEPQNFYIIIFNCLKGHYSDFFTETIEKLTVAQKEMTEII